HKLPRTHWTFLCGALALAGFPLLSGFWSKDEILDAAYRAGVETGSSSANVYRVLLVVGIVTAGLTAFYTFRAYFRTFLGPEKIPPEAGSHGGHDTHAGHGHGHGHAGHGRQEPAAHGPGVAHESPWVMTIPLMVLAVFAVGVGFVVGPLGLESLSFAD